VGEKQNQPFQLSFNPFLKVDFQGSRVTSDSGLLLVRELDERLGLSALIVENIMDDRRGKNAQLPLSDLLRQSIYSRLAGYEDLNDVERRWQDPTFRLIGSEKIWERGAALPRLQQPLVKTGGRLVKHARYYWLLLAEGHLNRRRFGAMLDRISLLPVPTG
jgi:Transposase DDE domain group 1